MKCDIATQTQKPGQKFIKLGSYGKIKLDRYYFDPDKNSILTIRDGKNGEIKKYIKPTQTNGKFIVVLRDIDNKPRTVNFNKMIEYCQELADFDEL